MSREEINRAAVGAQLGRTPRGHWRVARRCTCGLPQVIETDPRLPDGTPFVTLWWLTCRALSSAIGRLESGGWMSGFNRRLAENQQLRSSLVLSTQRYLARRDAIEPLGRPAHPGGGPDRVKCLHAHTAQHLVTGDNPVGSA
ncbi:MAG: DUF501 domain-containing protein, partial [Actinomycetota bacterium]